MHRAAAFLAAGLLLLGTAGCDRLPMPDWSFLHPKPAVPLDEVLPGRWKIAYRGNNYTFTFGRHSDVALVADVPQEYRARLGVDQFWIGGNYHVENDHYLNCQFTDGRWAELLAQMKGLEMHHAYIKSYTEDQIVETCNTGDVAWTRIAKATAVRLGEAIDIADQPPAISDAPRAKSATGKAVAGKPGSGRPPTKAEQQAKLTALFKQLEEKRKNLNVKDKAAVAEFNQQAADYSRQVAEFNVGPTQKAGAQ